MNPVYGDGVRNTTVNGTQQPALSDTSKCDEIREDSHLFTTQRNRIPPWRISIEDARLTRKKPRGIVWAHGPAGSTVRKLVTFVKISIRKDAGIGRPLTRGCWSLGEWTSGPYSVASTKIVVPPRSAQFQKPNRTSNKYKL
jgi:hypothetical protein